MSHAVEKLYGFCVISIKNRNRKQKEAELGGAVVQGPFGANRARNKGDRRKMTSRSFGPTPDVGFMHKGMLKAKLARR